MLMFSDSDDVPVTDDISVKCITSVVEI